MTANFNQENEFGRNFLDSILEWIEKNMNPEDVFSEDSLRDWGKDQEEWIPDPDQWAVENGYVKK